MAQSIPPKGRNKIKAWVKRFENARKAFRMPPDTPGSSTTEVNRQSYYETEINEKHAVEPGVSGLIRDEASVPAETIVPRPLYKHATEPVEAMQSQNAALPPVVAVQPVQRQSNSPPTVIAAQPHSNPPPPGIEAVKSQALDRLQPQHVQETPPGTFGGPAPWAPAVPGNVLVNSTDAPAEAPALLSPPRAVYDQEKLVSTESLVPAITLQGISLTGIHYPELGDKFDTRLVCIEPATSDPDKIECKTRAIALHDDEVYDALSHFWGPPNPQRTIILNGQPFVIREALFEALQALRDRNGTGWLWIDNISIDQENDLDKERQIGKMNVIYAYATRVFAWLGPQFTQSASPKDDAEFGVRFLARELSSDRAPNEREVRAVLAVVDRPYWERCWIIQEICSSKQVTIMCGSAEADFTPFWDNLQAYFMKYGDAHIHARRRQHFGSLSKFRDQETLKSREPQMSLIAALLLSRRSLTSIGRDKIFAILRLAHDSNKLVSTPNYTQDESIIFWKLAHNMINLQGHVAIILLARRSLNSDSPLLAPKPTSRGTPNSTHKRLSYISNTEIKAVKKGASAKPLPSWVPVWSSLADPLPKWIEDSVKRYHSAEPRTSHFEDVLSVRGVILEYITSISGMPKYSRFASPEPGGTQALSSMTDAQRSRQSTRNRFRARTMIVDFWHTVLGPVYAGKVMPRVRHQCGEFGCLGRVEEPEGVAIASVLDEKGNQTGEQSQIIRQWMNVNESLMVGQQTLRAWVDDIIKSAYNLNHSSKAAAGKLKLCDLSFEIDQLSQAFRMMEEYRMRLAVTTNGTFKLVYCEARWGDAICRIDHCLLPVVLRPLQTGSWLPQGSFTDEPQSMPSEEQEQTRETDLAPDRTPLETHHESSAMPPSHEQYTFIGEAFRFEYETASWANERYTGWTDELFDEDKWVDLWIA